MSNAKMKDTPGKHCVRLVPVHETELFPEPGTDISCDAPASRPVSGFSGTIFSVPFSRRDAVFDIVH